VLLRTNKYTNYHKTQPYTYNNIKYIVLLDGDMTVYLLTMYVFHHLKVTVTLLNAESWVCL